MDIQSEIYQEAEFEHSDADERSRYTISVIEEGRSSGSENALMIRPIAGPLQVLTHR